MTLALAACFIAFAQVVRGVTGFGSALVGVPLLTALYGPRTAIFVMAATDLVGSGPLVWDVRRKLRFVVLACVLPGLFVGQYIGTDLLLILDESTVRMVLGAVVGVFALQMVWKPVREGAGELTELPEKPGGILGLGAVAGFLGGLMSGLVGAGGPPIVIWAKRFFAQAFFRAQLIWIFLFSGASLTAMLWFKGATEEGTPTLAAMLLIPMLLGNRLGAWLAPKVPPVAFGRLVGLILLGTAGMMLLAQ